MITENELLDIELRNKGNADVEALLSEIKALQTERKEELHNAYDEGYDCAIRDDKGDEGMTLQEIDAALAKAQTAKNLTAFEDSALAAVRHRRKRVGDKIALTNWQLDLLKRVSGDA